MDNIDQTVNDTPMYEMRTRLLIISLVFLIALGILAACGSGPVSAAPTAAPAASGSTPTTAPTGHPFAQCKPDDKQQVCVDQGETGDFVTVVVPLQADGRAVRVEKLPWGPDVSNSDNFVLTTKVINFQVVVSDTGAVLREFDPPIRLQVQYTQDDVTNLQKSCKQMEIGDKDCRLVLAFREDQNPWIIFTQKQQFKFVAYQGSSGEFVCDESQVLPTPIPPPLEGFGCATIAKFADGNVGWGH